MAQVLGLDAVAFSSYLDSDYDTHLIRTKYLQLTSDHLGGLRPEQQLYYAMNNGLLPKKHSVHPEDKNLVLSSTEIAPRTIHSDEKLVVKLTYVPDRDHLIYFSSTLIREETQRNSSGDPLAVYYMPAINTGTIKNYVDSISELLKVYTTTKYIPSNTLRVEHIFRDTTIHKMLRMNKIYSQVVINKGTWFWPKSQLQWGDGEWMAGIFNIDHINPTTFKITVELTHKKDGWNPFIFWSNKSDKTIPIEVYKAYQVYKLTSFNKNEKITTDLSNLPTDIEQAINKLKSNKYGLDFNGFIRPDLYQSILFENLFPSGAGIQEGFQTLDLDL